MAGVTVIDMGMWRHIGQSLGLSQKATGSDTAATFSGEEIFPGVVIGDGFGYPIDGFVQPVNRLDALGIPGVLRGRNLLCHIATLPLIQYGPDMSRVPLSLLTQIDPEVPNSVTLAQTVEDLLFEGLSWWRITAFGSDGYPTSARHVDHRAVTFQPPPTGRMPANLPAGYDPRGAKIWVDGIETPGSLLIRFDSPNPALLVVGGRTIRRAIRFEKTAAMYANSPQARIIFTPADPLTELDPDVVKAELKKYNRERQDNPTAYIGAAVKPTPINLATAADLQLVELQRQVNVDVANLLGIDSEDLGVSTTSRTYQNAIDRRIDRVNETLAPYMKAITDRLNMNDVTKRGYSVAFDLKEYLKADPGTEATVEKTYHDMGATTIDEVRKRQGQPPLTAEQKAELKPPAPAQPTEGQPSNVVPIRRASASFSSDGPGFIFDATDIDGSFSVDEQRRTITGLVMPWGEIGRSGGRKWRFAKDSLKFSKAHANQIKLLVDHDNSQSVGRLTRTWSDDIGQWATYKVARGPEGDRALAMAADGARDGLSVGIGYEGDETAITWVKDPNEPGVHLVTGAPWRETSLVALPAFASARTTAVQMAADTKGNDMPETEPQTPEAAPVAAVTYTADQVAAMFAALNPHTPAAPVVPEVRQVVNPTILAVPNAKVNEGPLYRFDGQKAQRCFTADIASGFNGDAALRQQAEQFIAEQMGAAFANIATTATATLNPTIQRPDLYVSNLYFTRPIGSMVTGGVVSEITRQTLPKFSASAGLAASHVEGTEPTDGSFSTTSQNVDPLPISGRVTINREVIDQGGTPQTDQLIWNEMTQFYAKLLETRLVDALQALSLSDTAIVGTDGELQRALNTLFAGFQFVAGGDRFRGLALNQDLYNAIVNAVDGDGRSLFPMLNPTNAVGTTASDWSNVRVGSKVGVPAWALATGNGGPAKSFLFAPESVYQWFSPPRRIDLDRIAVATVGIGIWGYSAEFVTRNADVYQLAYTAS